MLELVPLDDDALVDQAAELLSAAWRQPHRTGCVAAVSDPHVARGRIQATLSGLTVAAVQDKRLVGYLAAPAPRPPGETVMIKAAMHATTVTNRRGIYREMYRHLAAQLTEIGGFTHTIALDSNDPDTVNAWFELGFGVDQVRGVQPVPASHSPGVCELKARAARLDDLPAMDELTVELTRFHAHSPMFRPALSDQEGPHNGFIAGMADGRSLVVVTDLGDSIGGYLHLHPDRLLLDTVTIGIASVKLGIRHSGHGTAMLAYAMEWAARSGYRYCAVEWTSPNLTSDRFWRSRGFHPVQYKLTRRIDSRVAWANPSLSYQHLRPLDL